MIVETLGRPLAPLDDWDGFEGDVRAAEVVEGSEADALRAYDVTFRPGARTVWHSHTVDPLLVVTAGHGIVAAEHEEREVRTGDIVIIPAGARHRVHNDGTETCGFLWGFNCGDLKELTYAWYE